MYAFGLTNTCELPNDICFSLQNYWLQLIKARQRKYRGHWCFAYQGTSWLPDSLRQSALVNVKCISSCFLYWSANQQANWGFHGFKNSELNHIPPYWIVHFVQLTLLFLYQVPLPEILCLFLFLFYLPQSFHQATFLSVNMWVYYFSLQ